MPKAVLVTTDNRGVYFGYVTDASTAPESLTLTDARVVVEWDTEMKGFLALAADGPNEMCRISRPTTKLVLYGVSTISEVSAEAAALWDLAPWRV